MDIPQFTEKDLHCIARLIQNSFRAPEQKYIRTHRPLYGCMYCKYASECNTPENVNFKKLLKRLDELTGVSLSTCVPGPKELGFAFLPASHYLEHPEDMHYLEDIHDHDTVENIKACLDKIISRSKGMSDQQ